MQNIHSENFDKKKVKLISFISFFMGFLQACFIYVMSSYFKEISGMENVGTFYLVSYAIVLLILLNFHKIIRKLGKSNVFYFSLLLKIIILALLMYFPPSYFTLVLLILFIIAGNLEWVSMDIILESFSSDNLSGRIRGKHLTVLNAGFILGPFLSTSLLERYGFEGIFLFLFVLNSIMFLVALAGLRNVNHHFSKKLGVGELLKKVMKRKNVLRIYYIAFALEFFYALMIIYTPIYLLDIGLNWEEIGLAFTVMLIPFVLVQYPMGVLADKKFGEKEFLIGSLFLLGATTLLFYFTQSTNVWVWAAVLFATRVGAALIEVLRDSYFYKRIDGEDVDVIDFFRTSSSVGYIIATGISAVFLLFFPIRLIFILVAFVAFSAIYSAFRLQDNKCEKELAAGCNT